MANQIQSFDAFSMDEAAMFHDLNSRLVPFGAIRNLIIKEYRKAHPYDGEESLSYEGLANTTRQFLAEDLVDSLMEDVKAANADLEVRGFFNQDVPEIELWQEFDRLETVWQQQDRHAEYERWRNEY